MNRRSLLLVGGAAIPSLLAGCSSNSETDPTAETSDDSDTNDTDSPQPDPGNSGENSSDDDSDGERTHFDGQVISGSDSAEKAVDLESGLTIIEAEHTGNSNFIVRILDSSTTGYGNTVINEIGSYEGATITRLDNAADTVDVYALDDWQIGFRQPEPTADEATDLPQSFSGDGPDVIGPILFSGDHVASTTYEGTDTFHVHVYPDSGGYIPVFFGSGEYESESGLSHDGLGWIHVIADGDWTLEIE